MPTGIRLLRFSYRLALFLLVNLPASLLEHGANLVTPPQQLAVQHEQPPRQTLLRCLIGRRPDTGGPARRAVGRCGGAKNGLYGRYATTGRAMPRRLHAARRQSIQQACEPHVRARRR
jgi:hypothetical protein